MAAKIAALEAEIAREDQIQQHMLLTLESMLDSHVRPSIEDLVTPGPYRPGSTADYPVPSIWRLA